RENALEDRSVVCVQRREQRREEILLERPEILRVLRPDHGELPLEPADPAREVRREAPVAAPRRVRALPPGDPDRRHELAGPRKELGDLLDAERRLLPARIVGHRAIVRTWTAEPAARSRCSSRTSGEATFPFRVVSPSRPGISCSGRRSDRVAAVTTGSPAAE